ncbi:hypothetical protein [Niastella populi]|uniref:Uncharacterized protein n=1 Tax=Niastella populi TaxID=550983 RepID=A0A1V9FC23_9BACT|nr:hypothetical protein [Niastella populi]OQP55787.1 hypothetical protein A4R26_27185 [Niastella populi]
MFATGKKIETIEGLFKQVMETPGLYLNDDSLRGTPRPVAKMYVEEFFNGLDPAGLPNMTPFENKYRYTAALR